MSDHEKKEFIPEGHATKEDIAFHLTRPFKTILSVITLIFSVFLCAYIYFKDPNFMEFWSKWNEAHRDTENEPVLNPKKFESIATILEKSGADSISIYSVDLKTMSRTLIFSKNNGKIDKNFLGDVDALFVNIDEGDSDGLARIKAVINQKQLNIQKGNISCSDSLISTSRYGQYLMTEGIQSGCAIGIPSGYSTHFIGIISVGMNGLASNYSINVAHDNIKTALEKTSKIILEK